MGPRQLRVSIPSKQVGLREGTRLHAPLSWGTERCREGDRRKRRLADGRGEAGWWSGGSWLVAGGRLAVDGGMKLGDAPLSDRKSCFYINSRAEGFP